jgi:hypothetical protein
MIQHDYRTSRTEMPNSATKMEVHLTGRTEEQFAMPPTNDSHSTELHFVLLAIATVIVTVITLTAALLRLADNLGPQIGDIIAFPVANTPSTSTTVLMVDRVRASSRRPCTLDVPVMQRFGGSLMIEAMQFKPDLRFQVHWAGSRTSDGQQDCGGSADLLLNHYQITTLVFAAGGTGVKFDKH